MGESINCEISGNGSYFSPSIYLKSKVFLAEDATDLLNAFLNIANNLRAASFNQDRDQLNTQIQLFVPVIKNVFMNYLLV